MNELIFFLHAIIIAATALGALRLGKEALIAFVALLSILSNLFITKQVMLFGFDVVATDAFAVGAVIGLQLVQEYFGRKTARQAIAISFFLLVFYALMSWIHLRYAPSLSDMAQPHFLAILQHMPRITLASLTAYLSSQLLDYQLYGVLKRVFTGRYLLVRSVLSLIVVQLFDTILFSFLGLYGIISSVGSVILVSFAIKMVVILVATPFVAFSKNIVKK